VATTPPPGEQDVYAVVRLDSFGDFTPRPENVSVRRVVHHFAEAELEVRHLNMTAPTGTVYFIQRTTVARRIDPAGAVAAQPLSPRSPRAPAEKMAGKKKAHRRS
jgi:hypothetical protein